MTGCTKVSQGCKHCYAERIAARFWGERAFTDVQCHEERLGQPGRWKQPRRVFVNSMSDLFHLRVPVAFIANVWAVMAMEPQHRFMVLTKRAGRMEEVLESAEFLQEYAECLRILSDHSLAPDPVLDNVWLGVSAETQEEADRRIPLLLATPARTRFVSIEPMLGAINLQGWDGRWIRNYLDHTYVPERRRGPLDWVICGGESGPGARPMQEEWARSLRDQCVSAGVPFFFKQWGGMAKRKAGRLLDGKEWNQEPQK